MSPFRRRGQPLRTRLLAVLLLLLASVSAVVGVTTEVVLHHYLIGRLDAQLTAAVRRGNDANHRDAPVTASTTATAAGSGCVSYGPSTGAAGGTGPTGTPAFGDDRGHDQGGAPVGLMAPGQTAGTVVGYYSSGKVVAAGRVSDACSTGAAALPAAAEAGLAAVPPDGAPHSRELAGLGSYRLVANRTADGDVITTGLPLAGVDETVLRLGLVELAVTAAGLVVAAVVGATTVRIALRPLARVAATATRVTQLRLDRGEVALADRVPLGDTDPRTEVGQVGAALNSLLGHVDSALTARQASETRVRQFVADASHELRTPLAAIRGYAELTRRGRDQAPPDIARALQRVESEAARMTTLVEDLLLLARLDSGRPLEAATVDLTSLVIDTVSDAHAAGPDHVWTIAVPDEAVEVPGDAARLHQVIANLLANARTHTPAGTTVTVGLRQEVRSVTLTVVDDGPGIPAQLVPTIFERFARGDSSRSRAAGSTGLGLAIVAAVVGAHGGGVEVESRPGRTAFTVTLPSEAGDLGEVSG